MVLTLNCAPELYSQDWTKVHSCKGAAFDSGWCSDELTCCTKGADCSTASYHFYNARASVTNHMTAVCLSGTLKYCWARVRTSLIKTCFCIRTTKTGWEITRPVRLPGYFAVRSSSFSSLQAHWALQRVLPCEGPPGSLWHQTDCWEEHVFLVNTMMYSFFSATLTVFSILETK